MPTDRSPSPPHLAAFLATFPDERPWAQILIRRIPQPSPALFELRHLEDRDAPRDSLRAVTPEDLRPLATFAADATFRPLRTAPTLVRGWSCEISDAAQLGVAIDHLYPGSLADWHALNSGTAHPLNYRSAIERRPGPTRQRLTRLEGPALNAIAAAACGPASCLRTRRWDGPGLPAESNQAKSPIPCLEPCPLFLRFADFSARAQEPAPIHFELAPADLATIVSALRHALQHPPTGLRPGDLTEPLHPWRLARFLESRAELWALSAVSESESHAES